MRLLALCCTVSAFFAPVARPWRRSPVVCASRGDQPNKVFVGKIAWKADVQLLREEMERFGEVRDAHMPQTDGAHRGFGFVTFDSAAAALAAIEQGSVDLLGRDAVITPAKSRGAVDQPGGQRQGLLADLRHAWHEAKRHCPTAA